MTAACNPQRWFRGYVAFVKCCRACNAEVGIILEVCFQGLPGEQYAWSRPVPVAVEMLLKAQCDILVLSLMSSLFGHESGCTTAELGALVLIFRR